MNHLVTTSPLIQRKQMYKRRSASEIFATRFMDLLQLGRAGVSDCTPSLKLTISKTKCLFVRRAVPIDVDLFVHI